MANGKIHTHAPAIYLAGWAPNYKDKQWYVLYGDTQRFFDFPSAQVPTLADIYPHLVAAIKQHDEGSIAYQREMDAIAEANRTMQNLMAQELFKTNWPAKVIEETGFIPMNYTVLQPACCRMSQREHTHDQYGMPVYKDLPPPLPAHPIKHEEAKKGGRGWLLSTLGRK